MTDTKMLRHSRTTAVLAVLFVLMLVATLARGERATSTEFDWDKFNQLQRDMDQFTREYWGCPPSGYPPGIQCNAGLGFFDAKTHARVVDEAAAYAARYK